MLDINSKARYLSAPHLFKPIHSEERAMPAFCGLDFGTSNTTVGVAAQQGIQLVPLENNKPTIRSAIFCDIESQQCIFGQEGINNYLEGYPGRLLMSLKSVLGSSLMDDKTIIFNEYVPYTTVLSYFVRHIKTLAEKTAKTELTQVVLGRPVHFHDHDPEKDLIAQNTLEKIARDLGFKDVAFQYEPIAAALTYEMNITEEKLALIIDMGGGTSDFTIIRLHPNKKSLQRTDDVLANTGIHIAGTDFDQRLSLNAVMPLLGMGSMIRATSSDLEVPSMFYHDLTTWHTLGNLYGTKNIAHIRSIQNTAYEPQLIERLLKVLRMKAGHRILSVVETAKQSLSDQSETRLDLSFIEELLSFTIPRKTFGNAIAEQVHSIVDVIKETIKIAGIDYKDIDAIFYTGGSTKIPMIRDTINALFTQAEVVQGDAFGSVGMGLTIEAQRRFC